MSFELRATGNGKLELVLHDEPGYVCALEMAPNVIEPELKSGLWFVVAFPIWSAPVRQCVRSAIDCAKHHRGKFKLGIRPYDYHAEILKWWPGSALDSSNELLVRTRDDGERREVHISTDTSKSPVWLVLRDGQVMIQACGIRSKVEVFELMRAVLDR
jgi:hypothetical protein